MEMPRDEMPAVFKFERKFEYKIPARSEWVDGLPHTEGDINVFTDGSKTDEGTGAGVYCEELGYKISIPLGTKATVFQSEIHAITRATSELIESGTSNEAIVIYTDNESSIKTLSACKISSRSVLECRNELDTLSNDNRVILTWVPGHSGIEGNEVADQLAKAGSATKFVGPDPVLACGSSLIIASIKEETKKKHQEFWDGLSTCRQAKEMITGCNKQTTKFLLSLSKGNLLKITGILTGHNKLNYHLNKMHLIDSSDCRGCGLAPETAKHFLCGCPRLRSLRVKYLGDYYLTPEELSQRSLNDILSFTIGSGWLEQ